MWISISTRLSSILFITNYFDQTLFQLIFVYWKITYIETDEQISLMDYSFYYELVLGLNFIEIVCS